jgi:hypothetical protein
MTKKDLTKLLKIVELNIWEDILKWNKVSEDHNNNKEDSKITCKIQTQILNLHQFSSET